MKTQPTNARRLMTQIESLDKQEFRKLLQLLVDHINAKKQKPKRPLR